MMLTNKLPADIQIPIAEAAEVMFDESLRIRVKSEKTNFLYNGKPLHNYGNYDVKGSATRDTGKMQLVYRDHVGRLTLEPVGKEAVGVLVKGGTNGRMSIVGFFAEVTNATGH